MELFFFCIRQGVFVVDDLSDATVVIDIVASPVERARFRSVTDETVSGRVTTDTFVGATICEILCLSVDHDLGVIDECVVVLCTREVSLIVVVTIGTVVVDNRPCTVTSSQSTIATDGKIDVFAPVEIKERPIVATTIIISLKNDTDIDTIEVGIAVVECLDREEITVSIEGDGWMTIDPVGDDAWLSTCCGLQGVIPIGTVLSSLDSGRA